MPSLQLCCIDSVNEVTVSLVTQWDLMKGECKTVTDEATHARARELVMHKLVEAEGKVTLHY